MRVGGNDGNQKKAESHLRRSESTQGAPGVLGGLFGVQEGAVGSQEVAGKWRCMNDFSQKVEDFSRFFEIGSFRSWRRRRWSRLAERSPKPVSPTKTDKGKWVSDDTWKIRRFSRRTPRPGYWPVTHPGAPWVDSDRRRWDSAFFGFPPFPPTRTPHPTTPCTLRTLDHRPDSERQPQPLFFHLARKTPRFWYTLKSGPVGGRDSAVARPLQDTGP